MGASLTLRAIPPNRSLRSHQIYRQTKRYRGYCAAHKYINLACLNFWFGDHFAYQPLTAHKTPNTQIVNHPLPYQNLVTADCV